MADKPLTDADKKKIAEKIAELKGKSIDAKEIGVQGDEVNWSITYRTKTGAI